MCWETICDDDATEEAIFLYLDRMERERRNKYLFVWYGHECVLLNEVLTCASNSISTSMELESRLKRPEPA